MEKLNINKLIANDIVNYGMDKTAGFQYIVSLDNFLEEYDFETRDYVEENIDEIVLAVRDNANVADLEYNSESKEFDMVFYYEGLLTEVEKHVSDKARNMGYEFEIENIRNISSYIIDSDKYDDLLEKNILKNLDYGKEL